jgi:hypothetical protein
MSIGAASALAQGTVWFSNKSGQVDVPFFDNRGNRLEGTNYLAQLYASPSESGDGLVPVGNAVQFMTGADSGYFQGGAVLIPFIHWRDAVWVQVRAWEADGGTSFESAALSGKWTGISNVLFVPDTGDPSGAGSPPVLPVRMIGLQYPGSPIIVGQPQDQRIRAGERAQFSVVGSGGITLSYQWYQGRRGDTSQSVAGATNATLTTAPLSTNTAFWVNLSTSAGATNSDSANVSVYPLNAALLTMQRGACLPTLTIDGAVDTRYRLQFSTNLNLANWIDLLDFTLLTNRFDFIDSESTNSPSRVYRAVVPP